MCMGSRAGGTCWDDTSSVWRSLPRSCAALPHSSVSPTAVQAEGDGCDQRNHQQYPGAVIQSSGLGGSGDRRGCNAAERGGEGVAPQGSMVHAGGKTPQGIGGV